MSVLLATPGAAAPPLAELRGLALEAPAGVAGLDLTVGPGDLVHLHGPADAGGGVLRALAGLERPAAGTVRLLGQDPAAPALEAGGGRGRRATAALRARFGWLPRQGALLANLTLRENLLLPLEFHGLDGVAGRVAAALACFGLEAAPALRPEHVPLPVRRRVALARAILLDPALLLLDDPLDDLDEDEAAAIAAALVAWVRRPGRALLAASPDPSLAAALGARRLHLPVTRP